MPERKFGFWRGMSFELALHEKYIFLKELSRKGAKGQSGYRVFKGFVCAFASLRETIFSTVVLKRLLGLFVQTLLN
ncbi:MAG TPA: hypothetical protein VFO99_10175 [Pyrinomonadaceae bacterium]|nr:hypothetical protein [Pyrinomonadaceae bacterium]